MCDTVGFVVGVRVVLGMVVVPVFGSSVPVVAELVLRATASEPPEAHIHHLDPAGDNCVVGNTAAVELSVWMGDFGCGHPMAMRVCRWGIISLPVTKKDCKF